MSDIVPLRWGLAMHGDTGMAHGKLDVTPWQ